MFSFIIIRFIVSVFRWSIFLICFLICFLWERFSHMFISNLTLLLWMTSLNLAVLLTEWKFSCYFVYALYTQSISRFCPSCFKYFPNRFGVFLIYYHFIYVSWKRFGKVSLIPPCCNHPGNSRLQLYLTPTYDKD